MIARVGSLVDDDGARPLIRAAQYVHMSTEHQKYSTENQAEVIAQYAARRGFEIVRTYDALTVGNRFSASSLTFGADQLTSMRSSFTTSAAGRFQDADESAYYEFICREGGINVRYCASSSRTTGSIGATIIKSVKRAMAEEYSRELSVKVFAGQCRLIRVGFRQGGAAGFGLRRQLVDEHHTLKAELHRGEQKSLQTDRVILTPGPPEEVEIVRRLYRMFVVQRRTERTGRHPERGRRPDGPSASVDARRGSPDPDQ